MVRMSPLSPMTTPVPSRSLPSVAELRALGTAWVETLTMASNSRSASRPSALSSAALADRWAARLGIARQGGGENGRHERDESESSQTGLRFRTVAGTGLMAFLRFARTSAPVPVL